MCWIFSSLIGYFSSSYLIFTQVWLSNTSNLSNGDSSIQSIVFSLFSQTLVTSFAPLNHYLIDCGSLNPTTFTRDHCRFTILVEVKLRLPLWGYYDLNEKDWEEMNISIFDRICKMRDWGRDEGDYIIGLDLMRDQCLYFGRLGFFGLILLLQHFSQFLNHTSFFISFGFRLKLWWEREDGLNLDRFSSLVRLCFPLRFGFFFHGADANESCTFGLTKFTLHIFGSLAIILQS